MLLLVFVGEILRKLRLRFFDREEETGTETNAVDIVVVVDGDNGRFMARLESGMLLLLLLLFLLLSPRG